MAAPARSCFNKLQRLSRPPFFFFILACNLILIAFPLLFFQSHLPSSTHSAFLFTLHTRFISRPRPVKALPSGLIMAEIQPPITVFDSILIQSVDLEAPNANSEFQSQNQTFEALNHAENQPAKSDFEAKPEQVRAPAEPNADNQPPKNKIEAYLKQISAGLAPNSENQLRNDQIDANSHQIRVALAPTSEDQLLNSETEVHLKQITVLMPNEFKADSNDQNVVSAGNQSPKSEIESINAEKNKKTLIMQYEDNDQASDHQLLELKAPKETDQAELQQKDSKPIEGPSKVQEKIAEHLPKIEDSEGKINLAIEFPPSPAGSKLDVGASKNEDHEVDKLASKLHKEPLKLPNGKIKLLDDPQFSLPNDPLKLPIDPQYDYAYPQPTMNSTVEERMEWLRMNWASLKILHSDELANKFPRRINDFLTGKSTSTKACRMQFFMTWISPLSSYGPREQLALESVFKTHPSACLVILSRTLDTPEGHRILHPYVSKGFRILAIAPHVPFLLKATPAERWFEDLKKGLADPGDIALNQNLSNLIRLLALYKYGGVYMDSDIIVTRSFANLSNVIGAQSADKETGKWKRLNNAVMVFDRKNPLLFKFIQEFSLTFNGSKWGHNGPYLVSRVVMRNPSLKCKVLEPLAFYPVDWEHIDSFFRAPRNSLEKQWVVAKMVQLKRSFAIHLWNKVSRGMEVEPGSIMDSIFRQSCVLSDMHTCDAALKAQA